MSQGDSRKAQLIIRNYIIERFLERLSLSVYRDHLILKGGVLVAAMIGLDNRSTMDVDATIKNLPLSVDQAQKIVEEITAIEIDDGMVFEIHYIETIMDEADYLGVRVMVNAGLETMRTPLKIDFSTGEVLTPKEITYAFPLLFEDRTISILAYNRETVLAEKLETLITRGIANTRMRGFYDLYALEAMRSPTIDRGVFCEAFANTTKNRGSLVASSHATLILDEVETSPTMMALWKNYQNTFNYATDIRWAQVMQSVRRLCEMAMPSRL